MGLSWRRGHCGSTSRVAMYLSLRCLAGDRLTLVSSVVISSKYIPASGQMTEKRPWVSVVTLVSSCELRYRVAPRMMCTSSPVASFPSMRSENCAVSPANRSFGWVMGTNSRPWLLGSSAVRFGFPLVTKVSVLVRDCVTLRSGVFLGYFYGEACGISTPAFELAILGPGDR